jgi:hypothetical protein
VLIPLYGLGIESTVFFIELSREGGFLYSEPNPQSSEQRKVLEFAQKRCLEVISRVRFTEECVECGLFARFLGDVAGDSNPGDWVAGNREFELPVGIFAAWIRTCDWFLVRRTELPK